MPKLVNEIYQTLFYPALYAEDEDTEGCSWTVGFVVGELAWLSETAKMRALTSLAHLDFLLTFFPKDPLAFPSVPRGLSDMSALHNEAVKAYRADFRVYREQGKSYKTEANYQQTQLAGRSVPACYQQGVLALQPHFPTRGDSSTNGKEVVGPSELASRFLAM